MENYFTASTLQGDAPGSFVELNLGFSSNDDEVFGCQNQTWQTNNAAADLTAGLAPGVYEIEVYTSADYTYTDGQGTHYANNDGNNFVASLTVADDTPPSAIAQNITVQLDAAGNGSTTAEDVDNGSNDACGIASLALSQTAFDCSNVGANNVVLTVTDVNGNESTANAVVTVEDNVAPVALAQNITVQLNPSGNGFTTAAAVDNGSNDACGIASLALSQTDFTCSNVGDNNVVLTVTDANGNESTASAVVTVEDNVAPAAIAQNVTVHLDASGQGSITAEDVDNGSSDACGIVSLSLSRTEFSCADIIVEDESAGGITDLFISEYIEGSGNNKCIEIYNGTDQDISLSAYTLQLYVNGSTSGASPIVLSGNIPAGGTHVVCNPSSVGALLTLADQTSGSLSFNGDDAVVLNKDGNPIDVIGIIGNDPGSEWGSGLTSTQDNTLRRKADILQGDPDGSDAFDPSIEWDGYAQDTFDGLGAHSANIPEPEVLSVVLTVTDANGNSATANAAVEVIDDIAPHTICQDVTVILDADGNGTLTAAQVDAGSTDNCGIVELAIDRTDFTCADIPGDAEEIGQVAWINEFHYDNDGGDVNEFVEVVANFDASQYEVVFYNGSNGTSYATIALGVAAATSGDYNIYQIPGSSNGIQNGAPDGLALIDQNGIVIETLSYEGSFTATNGPANGISFEDIGVEETGTTPSGQSLQRTGTGLNASGFVWTGPAPASPGALNAGQSFSAGDILMVTLTATDASGNQSSCAANVTVIDELPPIAICQNITAELDENGSVTITADQIDNGSTDNCGIASLSIDTDTFGCADVGDQPVVLTVTDNSGNTAICDATVTVVDNTAPELTCSNVVLEIGTDGTATLDPADIAVASDNCGSVTLEASKTVFTCDDVAGPVSATDLFISEYVEGSSNNKYIEIFNGTGAAIDLSNYELRTYANGAGTPNYSNNLGGAGTLQDGDVAVFSNSSAAIYGGTVLSLSSISFNGDDAVELYNVSTGSAIDIFGKIGQDPGSQWSQGGNSTENQTLRRNSNIVSGNTDDAADFPSLGTEWTSYDIDDVSGLGSHSVGAQNTVLITATDANGNISTCTASVTVEDNIAAEAIAQNVTVQLDASGNGSTTAAAVDNGSSDACGIASLALSQTAFDCSNVGANNVVLTVTDVNGNESTANALVTVEDNVAPEVSAQNVTVQLDASGNGSTTAEDVDNGSSDACGIASLALSQTAFDCSNVGANNVVLTVTDVNGNESTANAVVTVEDNVAPVASAQNVTVQLDASGNGSTTAAAVDNGSSDACGIASLALSQTAFDCSNVGANNVVLTVTDVNGNESTANALVTVEDNVAPEASAQNVTVQLDASGNGSTTAAAVDNGSSDACGIASLALSQTAFDCSNVGANNVVLTVTDVNGNESTANAVVTVEDNVAPVASAQNVTVQLDASGNGSTTAAAVDNGSSDACGIASLALSQTAFDCSNVGANNVVLTVTDVNGNESTANAVVTVEDNVAPVASAQNVTVQLDASGNGSTTAAAVDNGSSDACGIASLALSQTAFDCSNVGANNVVLTVTDVNGNEFTANAVVTVEDNVAPVASAQNVTVQLDASGNGSTTAAAVDNGSSDACGIASLALSQTAFDCSNVGANNVVLTVTDVNGNESTANAVVTVEDNVAPVASAQNVTVQLDASGNGSTTAAAVDNGSSDACGIASLALSQTAFDCANVGANNVVLTVTDVNGNESTANAVVTVEDNVAPVASAQNVTVQLDASGNGSTTAAAVDNGSSDACGIASLALSQTAFDCANVGANNVVLMVTDVNGNESTANAVVTVEDNVDPSAVCQNLTVQLDASGFASIEAIQLDGGSTDNCSVSSLSIDQSNFDCTNVGENTVELTVTDASGNTATCNAIVTVLEPLELPTAEIASSLVLTDNGNVVIFDNGPVSLGLPTSVVLTASLSTSNYAVASYQWSYRDVPDGLFITIAGAEDAELTIESYEDSHREYRVEIVTESGCEASAIQVVFSVDVSCKGAHKVKVCHVPPGNPDNAKEICVNVNAVDALLANSDSYLGSCDLGPKSIETVQLDPEVHVYPNPSRGRFTVSFQQMQVPAEYVSVFDMQGRKVMSVKVDYYTDSFQMQLNLSEYDNGMYMMTIEGAGEVIASELIVKTY